MKTSINSTNNRTLLLVVLAALFGFSSMFAVVASAQQESGQDDSPIKIVNRDGEAVDSKQLGEGIEIQEAKPTGKVGDLEIRPKKFGAVIEDDARKITIIDGEGKKQVIDISDARSVMMSHSSKAVVVDGVVKRETVAKATVVDADGKRHQYTLAPQAAGDADGPIPRLLRFGDAPKTVRATNQFTIGVSCEPVSELLATQLRLEPNKGLVVKSVDQDSPAAKAGVKKHDILMFAEDRELSKVSDLKEVVNNVGKESGQVPLTIIRGGKEIGIDVGVVARSERANDPFASFREMPGFDFDLGPGLHDPFGAREMRGFDERMDQMRKQMDQLREQMQR